MNIGDSVQEKEYPHREGKIVSYSHGLFKVVWKQGGDSWLKEKEIRINSCLNAKFKSGDTIEWYGKKYKVIGIIGSEMRINEIDSSGRLKHDGDYTISIGDTNARAISNSTNPVVANAVAWKNTVATNAWYRVGDKFKNRSGGVVEIEKVILPSYDGLTRYVFKGWPFTVTEPELRGQYTEVSVAKH